MSHIQNAHVQPHKFAVLVVARPGRSTGRRLATVKTLSREATVGGREQQRELNSHDQFGTETSGAAPGICADFRPCSSRAERTHD
jgi:hypothetical protein